ncbi:hypothetical protein BDC45DRAFT_567010 [Circinella umbellata]|nr:hypothetical protein BDC45DRAFT_567010 [Circinella umbellata]
MPRPTNPENVYKGMNAFKLNETPEQSRTTSPYNVENGEDSHSTTVSDDNSSSLSENNISSWSSETSRQFLAIIKANYMSIEQDDGVAHRQWNLMVDTYLQIKRHVDIVGVGDSRGQRVWEFYDEIDEITRDDSSINPRVIIESMDRGATGAHFYYNREEARDEEEERDYEWKTRFLEFSRAESSRFFQKLQTVLEEDRKRRWEDYNTFERNIRQR